MEPNTKAEQANVLLVDDRAENLVALEGILKRPDYRLITARSGKEVLQITLRENITVIVLDVVMPEMDGFEVAQYLKQAERTRNIPILFLTAEATEAQHINKAYDVGAADYLIKPLDPDLVRRKVAIFVELIRKREENARQAARLRESQRREYELRLDTLRAASLQRYRKLIDGIDHTFAWSADETPRLTFISSRAEDILGFPTEEFIAPDFFGQHIHPDDRERALATFDKVLREGAELTISHRMVAADGRVLWFRTAVSRERNDRGRPEVEGVTIDVTEIKRAEAAQAMFADLGTILSETRDYHASLQKLAARLVPDLADWCLIDELIEPGKLEERAAAHAERAQEVWLHRLEPRDPDPQSATGVAQVARSGRSELYSDAADERRLAEALGTEHIEALRALQPRSCMFVPLSVHGRTLGVITLVSAGAHLRYGPSDLAVAEEVGRRAGVAIDNAHLYLEAERGRQAREDLLAVVSHDLRNPLSSILTSVGMLDKVTSDDRTRKSVDVISRSARLMDSLIQDLLDFAQIQAGALSVKRQVTEATSLIRETVEVLKPLAEQKKLRLETQIQGELEVFCDRARVLQVLSNLVGNAIKFTPENGSVSIRVSRVGGDAEFAITDTGPGIPEPEIAHIWDWFWRTPQFHHEGVGLGLSIAKGLVEAHGGRIWVESTPGHGSTFFFTIPTSPPAEDRTSGALLH